MASRPRRESAGGSGSYAHSRPVEGYLRGAGWSPARRAEAARYEAAFEHEGISLMQATRDFLSRYGGLVIEYNDVVGQTDVLEFARMMRSAGSGAAACTGWNCYSK